MKLRHIISVFTGAFVSMSTLAADNHAASAWQPTPKNYSINQIRDLALIYQGGRHRPDWTPEQFVPYVTHTFADGSKDWLFDGFLFLEFVDGDRQYIPGLRMANARKSDWLHYLDRVFEPGKSLDALNRCIARQKELLGDPGFKHKVVLTVLPPIHHQKDWGELNGRPLDFDNVDDCKLAVRWFLDQLVDRFNNGGYDNLELTGIYWVDEDMLHFDGFPKHVAPYVHEKGLQFVWIPYFKAYGYDRWQDLGFDIAYHQPNHFFNKSIPDSRLDEACSIARQNGMALEFEFDAKALHDAENSSYDRMNAYIDAYWRNNVFTDAALAYYEGGIGVAEFAKNPTPENKTLIDRLARIIVDRRKNASLYPSKK